MGWKMEGGSRFGYPIKELVEHCEEAGWDIEYYHIGIGERGFIDKIFNFLIRNRQSRKHRCGYDWNKITSTGIRRQTKRQSHLTSDVETGRGTSAGSKESRIQHQFKKDTSNGGAPPCQSNQSRIRHWNWLARYPPYDVDKLLIWIQHRSCCFQSTLRMC